MTSTSAGPKIQLTGAAEISTPHFALPHGIDFLDEDTIVVANRQGAVCILSLPPPAGGYKSHHLSPVSVLSPDDVELIRTPGSVSVVRRADNEYDLLICNNYVHTISRHLLRPESTPPVSEHKLLLKKWLKIPDGICVSPEQRWIAISNHGGHTVMIYEDSPELDETSDPDGIMLGALYPHGLKFSDDGDYLLVADAGAPYVHVYGREGGDWRGVHTPLLSWRVLDQETYLRGRVNPMEGGPKGVDINKEMTVIAVTSALDTLTFFDAKTVLKSAASCRLARGGVHGPDRQSKPVARTPNDAALSYELERQDELARTLDRAEAAEARAAQVSSQAAQAEIQVASLLGSSSWRVTAPLRLLSRRLRELRAQFGKL